MITQRSFLGFSFGVVTKIKPQGRAVAPYGTLNRVRQIRNPQTNSGENTYAAF